MTAYKPDTLKEIYGREQNYFIHNRNIRWTFNGYVHSCPRDHADTTIITSTVTGIIHLYCEDYFYNLTQFISFDHSRIWNYVWII